jgi:hypothetical protein
LHIKEEVREDLSMQAGLQGCIACEPRNLDELLSTNFFRYNLCFFHVLLVVGGSCQATQQAMASLSGGCHWRSGRQQQQQPRQNDAAQVD